MESSVTIERLKTRVIIHKGATISTGQYSNERFDYTIDSEVPIEQLKTTLKAVDAMIDEKVSNQKKAVITAHPVNDPETTSKTPNELPWKKLPSGKEWIFADQKGAEELRKILQNSVNYTYQDAEYTYQLVKNQRFIHRFPNTRKKAENQ